MKLLHILIPILLLGTVLYPQERRIKPGDTIEIVVYGHQELSRVVNVSNQGSIDFPFMQNLPVDGLTLEKLREIIVTQLARYLNTFPVVTLNFVKSEKLSINVMGMVKQPGVLSLPLNSNLQGAIAAAGGLLPGARANEVVLIREESGKTSSNQYDLEKFLRDGDLRNNPVLKEGDIVLITGAQIPGTVMVLGEVRNPNIFSEFTGATVINMIMRAGGPTRDANVKNIRYITPSGPNPAEIRINLDDYLNLAGASSAPMVQAGDVIYVPKKIRIWSSVLGYVRDFSTIAVAVWYIIRVTGD